MKQVLNILRYLLLGFFMLILLVVLVFYTGDLPMEDLDAKYAPVPSEFVEIDGMNVHFRDEGLDTDSLPIILLHGTGSSLHTYDAWAMALKKDRRVVRLDLPAFGLTGPFPDRDYSMDHYSEFMVTFLDKMMISKCIIAGNSFGGQIAWNFTLRNPARVEKLILIDAAGYPVPAKSRPLAFRMANTPVVNKLLTFITPRSIAKSSVKNVYFDKSKVTPALVDRYYELTLRTGNRQALVDRIQTRFDPNAHERIKEISTPTLVLWGEDDLLIPLETAHRFDADLPNSRLEVVEKTGHVPMEERPLESLGIVEEFLDL